MTANITVVHATPDHYDFIRCLRNDADTAKGFIVQTYITPEQQACYMDAHGKDYFVALENGTPVGFIAIVDRDLRLAVDSRHTRKGIATIMLQTIMATCDDFDVCIKSDNEASKQFFKRHGFTENGLTERNGAPVIIMNCNTPV